MSVSPAQKKETPCPDCGEMVRVNSLRCWNCGAFMDREVEARFLEMQANPAPMIFSQLPDSEIHTYESSDDEDDFELTVPNPVVMTTPAGKRTDTDDGDPTSLLANAPAAETPTATGSTKTGASPAETAADQSPATAGEDALLQIALTEEAELRERRKKRRPASMGGMRTPGGGLIIYCPYGCKIEVKEEHRGMQGKCPKCQAPFIVPIDPPQYRKPKAATEESASDSMAGPFNVWMNDVHLHVVNPEKLKLKADSLAKEFVEVDLGFSAEHLLVALLQKKAGGLFGGGDKKGEARKAMYAHLKARSPLADTPVAEKYILTVQDMQRAKVVQPAASRTDNIFHGIPVFGAGKIAVQLPLDDPTKDPIFVSMGITEFWQFRKVLEEKFGIQNFGAECGLPAEPAYKDYFCHYTATKIRALEDLELYKADPKVELAVAGYRCGACGMAISEAGRAKENLGGKGGKGIAKAKCPKCSNKMGDNPLYAFKSAVEEATKPPAAATADSTA